MTLDEEIKHCEEVADYDFYGEEQLKCAEKHRQLAEWLIELKQLREQTRWIPIGEKLPEENKIVIASTKYSVFPEARYTKEDGWEWAYEAGADYWEGLGNVTAWMPLPRRYEPQESEDKE